MGNLLYNLRLKIFVIFQTALCLTCFTVATEAASRIKDIASIEGVRSNHLVGYGLVVGLDGTGDSLNNSPFTKQSLQAMLEQLGVNTQDSDLRTGNVAAVMVTSDLPAFPTIGNRIDVSVSSLGDASSLQGGTLIVTPLLGSNGEVYAVAQGPVTISGFKAEGNAASITRGVPTSGRISNGATIEKEPDFKLSSMTNLRLSLRNPDLTTARRTATAINELLDIPVAIPADPSTVKIRLPEEFNGNIVDLLTDIEQLIIEPDLPAKIIIDESSGIIVMGRDVRVSNVAVAQGNLTVTISENPLVSQPAPFSPNGQTTEVPRTNIAVDTDSDARLANLEAGVTLQELVDSLNALGIGPHDLISILQAIKAAGALQAEIEVI